MENVELKMHRIGRHSLIIVGGVLLLCFGGSFLWLLGTTVNGGSVYATVSKAFSSAIAFSIAPFLLAILCLSFWHLWKVVSAKQKPWREFLLLGSCPFVTLGMLPMALFSFPGNDAGNPWCIYVSFVISAALFTHSLYSMVAGRYRLLSGLGICISGPVMLIECMLSALLLSAPLIK